MHVRRCVCMHVLQVNADVHAHVMRDKRLGSSKCRIRETQSVIQKMVTIGVMFVREMDNKKRMVIVSGARVVLVMLDLLERGCARKVCFCRVFTKETCII